MGSLRKIAFHKSGRPRGWLRWILTSRTGGIRPILRRIVFKKNGALRSDFVKWLAQGQPLTESTDRLADDELAREWLELRWAALRPISVYSDTSSPLRITVVTDSVGSSSLFGGVGTALILAAIWAERAGANLRIVTRTERPVTTSLTEILKSNGLDFHLPLEYVFSPHYGSAQLSVGSRDFFMATSWWTARSLLNTISSDRIVYLLQEDERMFYPHGDDHLACDATLKETFAKVVINSHLLYHHLVEGPASIDGMAERAIFFEPAFPHSPRSLSGKVTKTKRKLFFYARPGNPRNLYSTGIQLINNAVLHGILDPAAWEIHLVGSKVARMSFDGGLQSFYHEPMDWGSYKSFLQEMDAGLSLMYTPHPSYPPIDLAAMGIPVLTNRFAGKIDLSTYSDNIITAELTTRGLLAGFARLVALAEDEEAYSSNLRDDRISRDWIRSLDYPLSQLVNLTKEHN